jgi:acetyltransferase
VLVADDFQRLGIGGELLRRVRDIARAEHLACMSGDVLSENLEMVRLCERHGFKAVTKPDEPQVVRVSLALEPEPAAS